MWNAISKKEYSYVRSREEKLRRLRLLNGLWHAVLLLILVMLFTGFSQTRAASFIRQRDAMEPFLALAAPDAISGLSLEEKLHNLNRGFYLIYGAECVLAVSGSIWYFRRIWNRTKAYLDRPMIIQRAVCTRKRDIIGKGCRNAFIDVETLAGEAITDVFVPWLNSREMGCGTPVLLTVGTGMAEEDTEFRAYPAERDPQENL